MEFNKSKDKEYLLPCKNCDNKTYHKVLSSVEESKSDEDTYFFEEFQIVICQGCKQISFRSNWNSSEDMFYIDESDEYVYADNIELYPSRIAGRKQIRGFYSLPPKIRDVYKETHAALCGKMTILAGIGVRVLIETICRDKGAVGKNLEEKIDNLVIMGILTKEGAEILHSTRLLGNQVVHKADILSERTLDVAMDVVEHLLVGVYVLPQETAKLPKRLSTAT